MTSLVLHRPELTSSSRLVFLWGYPDLNLTMPRLKYLVRLTDEERIQLEDLTRTGKRAASVILHARILLKADAGAGVRAGR